MKNSNKILQYVIVLTTIILLSSISLASIFELKSTETLIVRFKPGVSEDYRRAVLSKLGAKVADEIPQIDVFMISVPLSFLSDFERVLMQYDCMIDFIERDDFVPSSLVPNDQYYSSEWHLQKIRAPEAWDITIGSSNIIVAILDSGIDSSHPDLANKLIQGYNFYNDNYDTSDVYGHGTKVAGVVAAATNNGIGVASVGWGVSIMPIRVTDSSGYALLSLLTKGLIYAADRGAKVAVISFQIYGGSSLTSAAKYFFEKGGLVFAAGGNSGSYIGDANNPYIISVSATTSTDAIATFSTYGPFIDISAPGVNIYTTVKGGGYGAVSGTSFAAPIAAGVAALMFSVNPSMPPSDVESILKSTAVDLGDAGYDIYYGCGRIDASAALKALVSSLSPADKNLDSDSIPPTVTITYPSDRATLSGGVVVKVDASDDKMVSKVELYINGVLFAIDSEPPYEFYWDTTNYADGTYTLLAKAYDLSNNVGESKQIRATILNSQHAPTINPIRIQITSPLDGATVSGRISIRVSASSISTIKIIQIYIDDKLVSAVRNKPSCQYSWNTKLYKNGQHIIKVKVYDALGNIAETSITVNVRN
ncbi:MAG: S8 family serine peptidase [Candidatus Bathyarchaeia archaeon]|nr:S8 family serine peptidase [Candidatus Bathyarchaeota archaeon]